MHTKEILSIISIVSLGLCLFLGLVKRMMKKDSMKKDCDKVCAVLVFAAIVLLAVSQLLGETSNFDLGERQSCDSVAEMAYRACEKARRPPKPSPSPHPSKKHKPGDRCHQGTRNPCGPHMYCKSGYPYSEVGGPGRCEPHKRQPKSGGITCDQGLSNKNKRTTHGCCYNEEGDLSGDPNWVKYETSDGCYRVSYDQCMAGDLAGKNNWCPNKRACDDENARCTW